MRIVRIMISFGEKGGERGRGALERGDPMLIPFLNLGDGCSRACFLTVLVSATPLPAQPIHTHSYRVCLKIRSGFSIKC